MAHNDITRSGITRRQLLGMGLAATAGVAGLGKLGTARAAEVVTIYSADGLRDGRVNWYDTVFRDFTQETGITVQYVEGGSADVVNRLLREKSNTQADVLVTLPPFIQRAAKSGVLAPFTPEAASVIAATDKDKAGYWYALVNNYQCFIYNKNVLKSAPATFDSLLDPKFKGKIQYSTPGQAGDGTAMLLQVFHAFGGEDAGLEYFKKLQPNNVGPSSSTGRLAPLTNKGELWVANGDIQMNFAQQKDNPNIEIFWPANKAGERSTLAEPYAIGLVKGAPHEAAGKKLMEYMLNKKSQLQVSSIAHGFPVRSDVNPTDDNYKKLHAMMEGITIWTPDWDQVNDKLKAYISRWVAATM